MTGDEFRDMVAALLAAAGFRTQKERLITGKRVDIVAEAELLGRPRRYAIECKHEKKRLGISDISNEISQYARIVQDGSSSIDEAWIVSVSGFTDAALTHARSVKHLDLFSFAELESRLLDLRPYLQMLVDDYARAALTELYVPLRTLDGSALDDAVKRWLGSADENALAIVAGYGRGKTTYARRLAAELAKTALKDPAERMPIYIPLSEIAHHVKMSGLIAATIADETLVNRFSFNFFKRLNASGRFLLILDGFDEMKFGLTFEEFSQIFSQVHDLIVGNAKVLVLGRPSAFLSESEELAVLSGTEADQYSERRDIRFQGFKCLSIDLFTEEEGRQFALSYARARGSKTGLAASDKMKAIETRAGELLDRVESEVIRRPVHARMLGELAATGRRTRGLINHYSLYDYFTSASIDRELEKEGRDKRISKGSRRTFAQHLAWWSWTDIKRRTFAAFDIPDSVFDAALTTARIDKAIARRELIVSSILDRKGTSDPKLTFHHRSMQELLVADYALANGIDSTIIPKLSDGLTPELVAFFIDPRHDATLIHAFDQFLGGGARRFHIQYLRLFLVAQSANLIPQVKLTGGDEPFAILYEIFRRIGTITFEEWPDEALEFALRHIQLGKKHQSTLVTILLLAHLAAVKETKRKALAGKSFRLWLG